MWNKTNKVAKEKKPPFTYAIELLSRQEYSKKRLAEKLMSKGYTEKETAETLEKLEDLKLLNDEETSKSRFRFLYEGSKSSVKEIKYKLLKMGFSREDVDNAMPEVTEERELEAALKTLRLKYGNNKDPLKMRGYLYRRGFSTDICYSAVEKFME